MDMDIDQIERPRGTKRKVDDADLSDPSTPRRIKALHQDVVNKIAAGEIIIAPVHALKELIENAVDAGSTSLEILVKDGGLKLLQITDNGHGINREDLPILCERFTTSKLKAFEDLTSIGTYGFRGEALASISHIAHLTVTTKTRESSCAWRAQYADGRLAAPKPGQSAEPRPTAGRGGTQITVEDLFYNVPTRRRAFRSASEEYAKILDLVGRYAVHCSGVAFSCKKHGDSSMGISTPSNATVIDRIRQIHGASVGNELIEFMVSDDRLGFRADGYASNANYHVKRITLLLFINSRSVESSAIKKAIEQTYSVYLPKGGHPFVYLNLNIDPQRVDVNVHPTKREVNFLNEDEIIESICSQIRLKLASVDTSRTFITQTLLPGATAPVTPDTPRSNGVAQNGSVSNRRPTAPKTYENNLVRTDSKMRKITSMLPPPHPAQSTHDGAAPTGGPESVEYEFTDRQPVQCRLTTVKELRAEVRDNMHNALTEVFSGHTYVGIVDEGRRIAAIQCGVKLYLIDYGMVCNEYFYQLGLTDFNNFGEIALSPAPSLHALLTLAATYEEQLASATATADTPTIDWSTVVPKVHAQLMSRREMLAEYFSLRISAAGLVESLPLMLKGYTPSMAKLPRFLLRLGPCVDWTEEKACFRSFLSELAAFYVPEVVAVNSPATVAAAAADAAISSPAGSDAGGSDAGGSDADGDEDMLGTTNGGGGGGREAAFGDDGDRNGNGDANRLALDRTLENVLFPAFRARLVATKGLRRAVVEVADLKGLYRVFERC